MFNDGAPERSEPNPQPDPAPPRNPAQDEASRFVQPYNLLKAALDAEGDRRELDQDVRDEITQDIIVLVWQKYGDACKGFDWTKLPGFACSSVERALLNRDRRERRFVPLPDDEERDALVAPSNEWSDPEAGLLANELADRIERELATWSDAQRVPWVMKQDGASVKDIASTLGISVNTVAWHLANGREAMQRALDDDDRPGEKRAPSLTSKRNKKQAAYVGRVEPKDEAA